MAEEFGLEQVLRKRAAVHSHEGHRGAPAVVMQRTGDEFLAGPAFAEDEHGGLGIGHALNEPVDRLHAGARADHRVETKFILKLAAEFDILLERMHGFLLHQRVVDALDQLVDLKGLLDKVLRAGAERLHGALLRALPRNHDHGDGPVVLLDLLQ